METVKAQPYVVRFTTELFDISPVVATLALGATVFLLISATVYFIHSAPPTNVTISTGPKGSVFYKTALKYADILKRNGVKLEVLPSEGSVENLRRLADPGSHVDIGLVQAGTVGAPTEQLVSLGSISYQPLLVFYRGKPIELLSQFKGKKIAIGPVGSGSRNFALALLSANGIKENEGTTTILDWEAAPAAKALEAHQIDAAFVMSENASSDILKSLLRDSDVKLYSFKQANAYSRKIDYLNILDLPEGAIDFGLDIPPHDVSLLGPMIELVATKSLHPAISDLILEAAVEVHSKPGIFQHRGDFPAPLEHAIKISEDSNRFFKSGKSFFYKYLPFWLASLASRAIVVFFPLLVVLIPILRSIPALFRWRIQKRIHRRYHELLELEREFLTTNETRKQEHIRHRFDRIEEAVNKMRIPASFADQFYGLRGHIDYVRGLIAGKQV